MGSSLPAVNLGTGLTVTAVTTANRYACALVDGPSFTGRVKCWGERGLAPGRAGPAPRVGAPEGRGSEPCPDPPDPSHPVRWSIQRVRCPLEPCSRNLGLGQ